MKPFAILFLLMTLSVSSFAQSQLPAKNDRGDRTAAVEYRRDVLRTSAPAFLPVGPSGEQENSRWSTMGTSSSETDAFQINYTTGTTDPSINSISTFWADGVSCGSGTGFVTKKQTGSKPESTDSVPTGCQGLYNSAYGYDNNQMWQQAYNSGEQLVQQCANSTLSFGHVSDAFGYITQAAEGLGNGNPLRSQTYAWLKSVLYLNTSDPEYFCQCVYAMAGEIPVPNHTDPDTGYDWSLAVINWLIQNTDCDSSYLRQLYSGTRQQQIHIWENDTNAYKLDTTLPPLNVIDPALDTLLARHFLLAVGTPQGIISNATANPNPTGDGTLISFGISKEAYVKIELFDVLGHEVGSAGFESLFEPGNKSVPISLAGLPSGTYFVRILTAYGEVQSVKLVKE
jgi:hypothetical protein